MTQRNSDVILEIPELKGALLYHEAERFRYSPFGIPTPDDIADLNADGVVDSADTAAHFKLLGLDASSASYVPDADIDLDGVIGNKSELLWFAARQGHIAERGDYSSTGSHVGYGGSIWDPTVGLWLMRHRWFDPMTGRWLTRDPAGYVDGMSLYGYVAQRVWNAYDPMGLFGVPQFLKDAGRWVGRKVDQGNRWLWTGDAYASDEVYNAGLDGAASTFGIKVAGAVVDGVVEDPVGTALDFVPVVGDAKGVIEFFGEPSVVAGVAVVVGFIPFIGDAGARVIKQADEVAAIAAATAKKADEACEVATAAKASDGVVDAAVAGGKKQPTINPHTGKPILSKAAQEAKTKEAFESLWKIPLKKNLDENNVDFVSVLDGTPFDAIGNGSAYGMNPNLFDSLTGQIEKHLLKGDVILDMDGFPSDFKKQIADFVLDLGEEKFDKIWPIGF